MKFKIIIIKANFKRHINDYNRSRCCFRRQMPINESKLA
jgi:hypothetical protein